MAREPDTVGGAGGAYRGLIQSNQYTERTLCVHYNIQRTPVFMDQALGGDVPMCPCGAGGVSPHCRAPKQVPQRTPPYLRLAGAAAASGGGVTVTEVVAEARPMKLK